MVEQYAHLDQAFHALADATRRGIIAELARGERTVSRLAEPYEMSLAAVSKHVGVLVGAGLVHRQKVGREQVCTLQRERLAELEQWVATYARFWGDRLDALEMALKQEETKGDG
ncbi:ArsR family transcriptional regulator [Henriciella mobilis]|uniref:ArsR/SmtB family transcription factor n=1 Tax=Henriciella mobilis TaxID=2305467 RepID=UPI000E66C442|nr:metalloregulator ArsR/SmtB family transcription factor [Henriciella mobilis]RIJ13817.1 ArsR family transcriptional regulator [Henriciella mobilis]RIJ20973.1 ArsR family transcriptional regulator [Henriciella mobilis]